MNVTCPECQSIFRVDPAKIGGPGIRARCSVCGGIIPIATSRSWSDDIAADLSARAKLDHPIQRAVPASEVTAPRAATPMATAIQAPTLPTSVAVPEALEKSEPETAVAVAEAPPVVETPRIVERPAPPAGHPAAPAHVERTVAGRPSQPRATPPRVPPFSPARRAVAPPAAPPAATPAPARPAPAAVVAPAKPTPAAVEPLRPTPVAAIEPPRAAPPPPAPPAPARAPTPTSAPTPAVVREPTPAVQQTPRSIPVARSAPTPTAAAPPVPLRAPTPTGRPPINPFLSNDPNAKARRLARALVSDMVAYHPQKRAEGIKTGTLKQLFREEIRKSYEEYVDQIGQEFAESTTHFQDALNDVLAAGKRIF